MKLFRICVWLFFYFSLLSFTKGATTIEGKITSQFGQPLEYINIGIVGTKTGTISNQNGEYTLVIPDALEKEGLAIRFSSIGYAQKTFPLQQFIQQQSYDVKLAEEAFTLKTILVKPKFSHIKTIGSDKTNTKRNVKFAIAAIENQNLGAAIGKKFTIKQKTAFVESYHFHIKYNNFDTVRFRIDIQEIDNNSPIKSLLRQNIIKEVTGKKTGWIDIDLSSYDIYATKDILVSISWVYHSKEGSYLSLPLKFPALGNQHFYKFGSQDKWRLFKNITTAMQLKIAY